MTPDELLDKYRAFTHEAVRVEALQHYVVPGDQDRQQAFREGRPLPTRPDKQTSVELIADAVAAGKTIWRIHVVDFPLSDYVRYEIAAYAENIAAGEHVWIADRASHPGLDAVRRDFALFDHHTDHASLIWYNYTPAGQLVGYTPGVPDEVAEGVQQLALAREHASPLVDFMTSRKETR